jgi:murein DD-endopeptidase MepM/ murein hydrolase activator NlpD
MRRSPSWLIVVVTCLLWAGAGTAAADPRIERAREDLARAGAAAAQITEDLDRAAAQFEQARAHAERLAREAEGTQRTVATARSDADAADSVFRDRLLMLYAHPELGIGMLPSAAGPDVGESLHRVELIGQLARRGAEQRVRADRAVDRVQHAEHDYRVVTAGVRDAVRVRRDRAAGLSEALNAAQRRLGAARRDVREAQAVVAAEEAQRRRRARERAQATAAAGPLPALDGKTCPIGGPNAFSDTWGAPRSGGRSHQGVDMFAEHGMALYAVAGGTVRTSNSSLGGLSIHLTTDDGDRYYYAHLSETLVSTGQRVRAGQPIGANGNSGNARTTPPHLHWEYHPDGGAAVNPYPLAFALCRS